jgi:hypothetical protein
MPLIEAALAFAITMLVLSLIVSSIVEVIHRTFKLREKGLEYMLGQLFDRVLSNYLAAGAAMTKRSFVTIMTENRAPLHGNPAQAGWASWIIGLPWRIFRWFWTDPRVKELSPSDFMERLGSSDLATAIKVKATAGAQGVGVQAAQAIDLALKDAAQKFDAFGKDAGLYFEARARIMSVAIAIGLAFVVHVDAVDLFTTYLRDPNARAKVIEQAQAVTSQYRAAKDAADALKQVATNMPSPAATDEQKPAAAGEQKPAAADPKAAYEEAKKKVDELKQQWTVAIGNVDTTVKEYADLGVPLGWTADRIKAAKIVPLIWSCPDQWLPLEGSCATDARYVWFEVPTESRAVFYLLLGGLLIGLGSPFWYDVVTKLTSLRNATQAKTAPPAPQAPAAPAPPPADADKAQPVTPVGAFDVAEKASKLRG